MQANEYWRATLTPELRKIYDSMRSAITLGRDAVAGLSCSNPNEIVKAYDALWSDHPEVFWIPYCLQLSQVASAPMGLFGGLFGGGAAQPSPTFTASLSPLYSSAERAAITRSIDSLVRQFVNMRSNHLEVAEAVADYLAKNVEYAIDNEKNQNAGSAIHFKRAQCSGVAKAYKLILDRLGIWCIVVTGDALAAAGDPNSRGPHAWCIVRIDGKYYHVDPTFLISAHTQSDRILNNAYFLGSDDEFGTNHFWDRAATPTCPDTSPYRTRPVNTGTKGANTPVGRTAQGFGDGENIPTLSSLYQLTQLLEREIIAGARREVWFDMQSSFSDEGVARHVNSTLEKFLAKHSGVGSGSVKINRSGKRYHIIF